MKKFTVIIACFAVMVCLASCNANVVDNTSIYGTWKVTGALIDGAEFTAQEIEALGDDSLNGLVLVIKKGGKVYARNDEFDELLDLMQNDNEFTIGELRAYIKDGHLYWENEEYTVILTKSSESQMITVPSADSTPVHSPENQPSPTDSQIANNTPISTPTVEPTSTISPSALPSQSPLPKNDAEWLALAKKIVETQFLSRPETVMELINNGCSIEKAEQYVLYCDVDWNVSAVKTLERLCNNPDNFIPSYLYDLMDDLNFLYEEIDYAFENADVDWVSRALSDVNELLQTYYGDWIKPVLLYEYLYYDCGYNEDITFDTIDAVNIDWLGNAKKYIEPYFNYEYYDEHYNHWYSQFDLVYDLEDGMFSYDIIYEVLGDICWDELEVFYIQCVSNYYLNNENMLCARFKIQNAIMGDMYIDDENRIEYLTECIGLDWNAHAVNTANYFWKKYYAENCYTDSEIIQQIKFDMKELYEYKASEIDYAIKNMTKSR